MKLKNNSSEILFRASENGLLMTEPRTKSPMDSYLESKELIPKLEEEYSLIKNKETKSAQKKLLKIHDLKISLPILEKNKDGINLSQTCISQLIKIFVREAYGKYTNLKTRHLEKGNIREDDALTLLSVLKHKIYHKNTIRINNDFFTGEPDTSDTLDIMEASETLDTKCNYLAETFFNQRMKQDDELNKIYEYQGHTYMNLTGAKKHTVCYALLNGLENHITSEKSKLKWDMQVIDESVNEKYIEACRQVEINHIHDIEAFRHEYPYYEFHNNINEWCYDIPKEKRLHTISFERDDDKILSMKKRITECRWFMDEYLF